ncbi:hypothetical protein Ddye_005078 [Dipteronia dyeriana]|uniref:Uncharacterized protein n=1 Tax=Dipteronia dyeriana TaxID=168575 RepID=A0AAD9XFG9_9ROSI|nr:hypothetical protein Ddye_005078 [Dipteronia dyeriana]
MDCTGCQNHNDGPDSAEEGDEEMATIKNCQSQQEVSDIDDFAELAGVVDLLEKMLVFDQNKCIIVDEALCYPYLAPLHDINKEPVCPRPFSFDFDHPYFTEENIKELIYRETVNFNPDPTH